MCIDDLDAGSAAAVRCAITPVAFADIPDSRAVGAAIP